MPAVYNSIVDRADAAPLIPEDVAAGIVQTLPGSSAALSMFRRVSMSAKQQRLPVLSALPVAYFVNGDTGLKQTTDQAWGNVFLNAEEIACIVPIPEVVIDDAGFPIWAEIQPRLVEAIGRTLDAAIFFGVNKPATWPTDIVAAASDPLVGNVVTKGSTADKGGIAADIDATMGLVEDDGFDVSGFLAKRGLRGLLRAARDTTGQKLLDVSQNEIEGSPVNYALAGQWPEGAPTPLLIAGDFSQGILAVRQDITFKLLDQAVITDDAGKVLYNLAQQDSVAMRVVARFAFAVPNPLNHDNPDAASRYPFAVLNAAAGA